MFGEERKSPIIESSNAKVFSEKQLLELGIELIESED